MKNRVLIFSTAYFPLVGGAEVAMRELTDRLSDYRFDLICARIEPGLSSIEKIGNVTVHRLGIGRPIDKYLLPILGPLRALCLTINDQHFTMVWSLMASYGGFAALIYTWFRPRTKMLLTLQEGDPLEHYDRRAGPFSFLHKNIFRRADAVQVISRFLGDWAKNMGFLGQPEVIPNGVDVVKYGVRISADRRGQLRHELGFADGEIVIVTTSRLILKNAVDDLILSLLFLPEPYKVLIIGIGEDEGKLRKLVDEKQLSRRSIFLGKKTQDELPALLQVADIFCRPSLSESLGVSFLEALASGIPIIATPVGGIPDFLVDGETGVFCQPRNPESIAAAVKRIQEEPGLREKLVRQGEALVRERYDWEGIAKKMDALLNRLAV